MRCAVLFCLFLHIVPWWNCCVALCFVLLFLHIVPWRDSPNSPAFLFGFLGSRCIRSFRYIRVFRILPKISSCSKYTEQFETFLYSQIEPNKHPDLFERVEILEFLELFYFFERVEIFGFLSRFCICWSVSFSIFSWCCVVLSPRFLRFSLLLFQIFEYFVYTIPWRKRYFFFHISNL